MALPIFQRTVTDSKGDVIEGAQVSVFDESTGLPSTIYSNREGTAAISNPFLTGSDGLASFYAQQGEYRISVSSVAGSVTWRYQPLIGTLDEGAAVLQAGIYAQDAAASANEAAASAAGVSVIEGRVDNLETISNGRNKIFYDDQGNPNVMVWINKFNCEDVNAAILAKTGEDMNLGTGTHPAFIKDGVEMRGFWYGKYQASTINSVNSGCSVISSVQPRVSLNYDAAKSFCTNKGANWHLASNHEWFAVALLSAAYGAEVRGNTNYGRAHDAKWETGRRGDILAAGNTSGTPRTDCGTGPSSWSHDGTEFGVFDMVGNVWEWVDLLKLQDGNIIIAPDNNPDLGESNWTSTTAYYDGSSGTTRLNDSVTATGSTSADPSYNVIEDASYTKIELLRRLGLEFDGDVFTGRLYVNNDGDRFPRRGGSWHGGSDAGLGALYLADARSNAYASVGFRPALFA